MNISRSVRLPVRFNLDSAYTKPTSVSDMAITVTSSDESVAEIGTAVGGSLSGTPYINFIIEARATASVGDTATISISALDAQGRTVEASFTVTIT